jgi:hypothetical protein
MRIHLAALILLFALLVPGNGKKTTWDVSLASPHHQHFKCESSIVSLFLFGQKFIIDKKTV